MKLRKYTKNKKYKNLIKIFKWKVNNYLSMLNIVDLMYKALKVI
jgi:hypothetical protein